MLSESIVKINRSSRKTFFAGLLIIFVIGMYNWMVNPHASYLFAIQRYKSAVIDIEKKSIVINRTVKNRNKKLQNLREQINRLLDSLFSTEQADIFFSGLQSACENNGCSVYSLNFNKSTDADRKIEEKFAITPRSATLNLVGPYQNIIKLIENLQNGGKKVWIKSLGMSVSEKVSSEVRCGMVITVYINLHKERNLDN